MSEVIAVCLLVQEDADSIKWMVDAFKQLNPGCRKVHAIMADKDMGERDVLKQCFPSSTVLICLFHTLRSFRREISCEKMRITSGQRTACLELIQRYAMPFRSGVFRSLCPASEFCSKRSGQLFQ